MTRQWACTVAAVVFSNIETRAYRILFSCRYVTEFCTDCVLLLWWSSIFVGLNTSWKYMCSTSGCTRPRRLSCLKVVPNICGCLVRNLFHIRIQAPRILRWSWKIYTLLYYSTVRNIIHVSEQLRDHQIFARAKKSSYIIVYHSCTRTKLWITYTYVLVRAGPSGRAV